MNLSQIGEFGLIDILKADTINDPGSVVVGIGDDAAVLLPTPKHLQLLTTDMLVEDVHFSLATTTAWQLGYKAIAVNISDITAMGGIPRHAVVSIAIPKTTSIDFIINLYAGMKEICRYFKVNIVGGDTVSSPKLVINVAIIGEVEPAHLQKRAGAQVGDIIAVTGTLGNSSGGLDLLMRGEWEDLDFAWPLVNAHLTPRPQLEAGQLLAKLGSTSMNDISDGLANEVNEIASASNVGVHIHADKIPISNELRQAAALLGKEPIEYALYGGEDYQLVFTMEPSKFELLSVVDSGLSFTAIGHIVDAIAGVTIDTVNGDITALKSRGYNHFLNK